MPQGPQVQVQVRGSLSATLSLCGFRSLLIRLYRLTAAGTASAASPCSRRWRPPLRRTPPLWRGHTRAVPYTVLCDSLRVGRTRAAPSSVGRARVVSDPDTVEAMTHFVDAPASTPPSPNPSPARTILAGRSPRPRTRRRTRRTHGTQPLARRKPTGPPAPQPAHGPERGGRLRVPGCSREPSLPGTAHGLGVTVRPRTPPPGRGSLPPGTPAGPARPGRWRGPSGVRSPRRTVGLGGRRKPLGRVGQQRMEDAVSFSLPGRLMR